MSQHFPTDDSQPIKIFYEAVSTGAPEEDPIEIEATAGIVVKALKKEGYTMKHVQTGPEARGFDTLYQIIPQIPPIVQATLQTAITHKDDIATALNVVKPIIAHIIELHKQRVAGKAEAEQGELEFEARFGTEEDVFRFRGTGSNREEHFQMALDRFETFLKHSQHAHAQPQAHVVEQMTPQLTIREHVPPRPRRRK